MAKKSARSITFNVLGLETTLVKLDHTTIDIRVAAKAAINAAGAVGLARARKAVGLRDHSLTDLANMGHPYARRHGSIRIHTDAPWQVHRAPTGGLSGAAKNARAKKLSTHRVQTDALFKSTQGREITAPSGTPAYEVYFDLDIAPHAENVVLGTKRMLPRDPLWNSITAPGVQQEMMEAIVKKLGKELRSKLGVRRGKGAPVLPGKTLVT